ncbi:MULTISPECIES: bifunctional tetrahydrofolate synthase/dihydrofolate synthase [unclassified Legionella]|uniref:bifunctional tetrahydrofolate synthase/dihydrofolate synthase n=1 Tax=unclassified Legionella TaxID=2622702 RepID=UPI0010547F01|nr:MULTISPECIES: bifunctional tetrahydrofolate synthase/dihydrofolate synthase [unclassified Legionella]MDI9818852.1 bifunctional tetrahydrofolate synthase/dihydrofolate synthase [Legionella sp. PL877]
MKPYKNYTVAEWLYELENRHQQEIQLGLARVKQVAASLGLLHPNARVISVAGTNGKGSAVASLEAIYLAAGYQVASYTSPHLFSFNERIKINQRPITDEEMVNAFCVVEEARASTPLTYFEMATLAALWHFKNYPLDLIILEVGLGGRLDATNIIDADLAIITTVDFDHQEFLGDNKEAIGFEKAGILRQDRPFIFADKNIPESILAHSHLLGCSMYLYSQDYDWQINNKIFKFSSKNQVITIPEPVLHPNSIAAAIMACLCMREKLPLSNAQIANGLKSLFLPGRLELQHKEQIKVLFDVSHNPQAVNYMADYIRKLQCEGTVHAVFSALRDKDISGLVAPLIEEVGYWYPALLTGKRAPSAEQFSMVFSNYGIVPVYYSDPVLAYQAACNRANAGDLIIVYGSFITVGHVMSAIQKPARLKET